MKMKKYLVLMVILCLMVVGFGGIIEFGPRCQSIGKPETTFRPAGAPKDGITKPVLECYYTQEDIEVLTNVLIHEAGGIQNDIEVACVAWVICNWYDAFNGDQTFLEIVSYPHRFAYLGHIDVTSHGSYNRCRDIAEDVLRRWNLEQNGYEDVGRVLPEDYVYFSGRDGHNWFRNEYESNNYWDYSLENVYLEDEWVNRDR